MSLQGSIHTWSDGIGYGAFIPTDRAYYNVKTPRASGRRPSSEQLREYRRHNVTGGIDTHRSNMSFGKTTESVRGGLEGDPRAREATKSLTSGEVGSFCWPAERARDGDVETILASSSVAPSHDSAVESSLSASGGRGSKSANPPVTLSARSVRQHEHAAEATVVSAAEQLQRERQEHRQPRGGVTKMLSSSCNTSSNHSGSSTQRSDSTYRASSSSSTSSYNSSRLSTFRSSIPSSRRDRGGGRRGSSNSSNSSNSSSGRRTRRPTAYNNATVQGIALTNGDPAQQQQLLSHRSTDTSARENRLRPPRLLGHRAPPTPSSSALPQTRQPPRFRSLDPVFDRHHKYDLVAEERAAQGGEVTGRFGEIQGSSVMAANLLTSELSTPWSHVLRGQKW